MLTPLAKCVRVMEEAYVNWIIAQSMSEQFKDDMHTIMVMPQGLKKVPIDV